MVQVSLDQNLYCGSIVPSEPILYEYGIGTDYCHFTIKANDASAKVSNNKIILTLNETVTAIGRYSGGTSEYTRRIQIQFDLI